MRRGYLSELFLSFQGEGAHVGERHLFLRLAGCNLRCRYCDTPASLERTKGYEVRSRGKTLSGGNPVTSEDVRRLIRQALDRQGPVDALAITGGEPLLQSEFIAEFLGSPERPLPVLLETSGVLHRQLEDVLSCVDVVSMDVKLPSNTGERPFWSEHEKFLALARQRSVYVKILVDDHTEEGDFRRAVELVASQDPGVRTFVQPILDGQDRPTIGIDRLSALYTVARASLQRVRVLPQTHKLLSIP